MEVDDSEVTVKREDRQLSGMICAMPPLTFLTFLFALATGLLSLAWVSRRSHHQPSPVTESLISPLLYYNLWVLTGLLLQYAETTLRSGLPPLLGRALIAGLVWISMLAAILWGSSYFSFTLRAIHLSHPHDLLRQVRRGALILLGATAITSVTLFILQLDPMIRMLSRGLASLIFLTVAILSLWLLLGARRRGDATSGRSLKVLGAAYSLLFAILTTLVWWHRLSPRMTRDTYVVSAVGLEILYNLVTVLWIHFYDCSLPIPVGSLADPLPLKAPAQPALDGFGISKRELEVIQLICQGRTNQEIADALYISLKTVKDHNYRIFQQTGVRNRVELVQLAQESMKSEQAGEPPTGPKIPLASGAAFATIVPCGSPPSMSGRTPFT
jgi:DNA-binding CsgD family transcriptional regulator